MRTGYTVERLDRARDSNAPEYFPQPAHVMTREEASERVRESLACWQCATPEQAKQMIELLASEFPDQEPPDGFWDSASSVAFRDFFVWGHDHDFGHGFSRQGAMLTRHLEIAAEGLALGLLPVSLTGKQVLDVGCWSGGDLLILAGLGGDVTAIEEHPVAARAARRLSELVGARVSIEEMSLYSDRREWAGKFDYIYCAGVIYHVTDPMLFARILFAYLKPGGEVYLETKSTEGEGSVCSYSGTLEKGWNWYAPNETAFGRWLVDAGFDANSVRVHRRVNGRLLAWARKSQPRQLRETAGFSRPGSWLEGIV